MSQSSDSNQYLHKVRVRVCGLLIRQGKILLLKHRQIGPGGYLWAPPGGGLEFDDTPQEALVKEFLEETYLHVEIGNYLFTNQYRDERHHAIELFFEVYHLEGNARLGHDPEISAEKQILEEIRWFNFNELKSIREECLHNIFKGISDLNGLLKLNGFIQFDRISIK